MVVDKMLALDVYYTYFNHYIYNTRGIHHKLLEDRNLF